jgi:hypothetical protein
MILRLAILFGVLASIGIGAPWSTSARADGVVVEGIDQNGIRRATITANASPVFLQDLILGKCRESGLRDCRVIGTFKGTCASAARSMDGRTTGYAHNSQREQAKQEAVAACTRAGGSLCRPFFDECDELAQWEKNIKQVEEKRTDERRIADATAADDRRRADAAMLAAKQAEEAKKAAARAAAPLTTALDDILIHLPLLLFPLLGFVYGWVARFDLHNRSDYDSDRDPALAGLIWGAVAALIYDFTTTGIISSIYLDVIKSADPTTAFFWHVCILGSLYLWKRGHGPFSMWFGQLTVAPFWLPGMLPSFIRGTIVLFSRHPAERVISPALRSGRPIDGRRLVEATTSDPNAATPGVFSSWVQSLRGRRTAERVAAATEKAEADRDIHLAAHRLEIARAEAEAAREALAAAKREAKERRKSS